ncbi:hypothetical protein DFS33DRAFT_1269076 [Desarmillaria ectypa]|nr:hypothetical protein DFS33DRAFT_1269076 [Desarmillaria ectypa]
MALVITLVSDLFEEMYLILSEEERRIETKRLTQLPWKAGPKMLRPYRSRLDHSEKSASLVVRCLDDRKVIFALLGVGSIGDGTSDRVYCRVDTFAVQIDVWGWGYGLVRGKLDGPQQGGYSAQNGRLNSLALDIRMVACCVLPSSPHYRMTLMLKSPYGPPRYQPQMSEALRLNQEEFETGHQNRKLDIAWVPGLEVFLVSMLLKFIIRGTVSILKEREFHWMILARERRPSHYNRDTTFLAARISM